MVQDYSQRECPAPEKEKAKKKKAGPHTYKRPTLLGQKNIALGTVIYNRERHDLPHRKRTVRKKNRVTPGDPGAGPGCHPPSVLLCFWV